VPSVADSVHMEPLGTPVVAQLSSAPVPVVTFLVLAVNEVKVGGVAGATVTEAVFIAPAPPVPGQLSVAV
jgi:hypothetical protein